MRLVSCIVAALVAGLWAALAAAAPAPPHPVAKSFTRFEDTPTGGVESVLAADPVNADAIQRMRARLASEAQRFSDGELPRSDEVNGRAVPALTELAAQWDKVLVTYTDIRGGARITYSSEDRAVVAAIHDWFAARRSPPPSAKR